MSYKTNRLANLFPDVYAARETESLLYKLLDAIGAELMAADESVKELLKSHWVNYASGTALDGLAAIYGIARRSLPGGVPEPDELLRQRLKSLVSQFTGGGTREAIKGAVRSALGLPFDLDQLDVPGPLRAELANLIVISEFPPAVEWLLADSPVPVHDPQAGDVNELSVVIEVPGVGDALPEIRWMFNGGSGRRLSLERLGSGQGIKSTDDLLVPPNAALTLAAFDTGELDARLAGQNVTTFFTNLDGTAPAILPAVPGQRSQWRFRAQSGVFDVSAFDVGGFSASDTFDLPDFGITLRWERRQPLTFDVFVPYFLSDVVEGLAARYHYTGALFVYEGLPLDVLQEVVDQTRAAGVRGNLHLALNFYEDQAPAENPLTMNGLYRFSEDAAASDTVAAGSIERMAETQNAVERFSVGGVYDFATFDSDFGFQ